jgi:hypothetical protein
MSSVFEGDGRNDDLLWDYDAVVERPVSLITKYRTRVDELELNY